MAETPRCAAMWTDVPPARQCDHPAGHAGPHDNFATGGPASLRCAWRNEPTPEQDETKPLTDRERELISQRCRNHEAGHDTGLTSRAVLYLYGYEALVAALRSSLEEARKDSERLDWLMTTAIEPWTRASIDTARGEA